VPTRPTPAAPTTGLVFDDGKLGVLGVDFANPAKPAKAGDTVPVYVYFEALGAPSRGYKFQVMAWPADVAGFAPAAAVTGPIKSPNRATLDGLFASDRWRPGEIVRDKFELKIPPTWTTTGMAIALVVTDEQTKVVLPGTHPGDDKNAVTLGVLPIVPGKAAPAPPPTPPPAPTQAPGSAAGSRRTLRP